MITNPFHHRARARVAHGKSIACLPSGKQQPICRAVQYGVADNHVQMTCARITRIMKRSHTELGAVESLPDVVVRFAFEFKTHAANREGTKTLPCTAGKAGRERTHRQPSITMHFRDRTCQAGTDSQVVIANRVLANELAAVANAACGVVQQCIIE